MEEQNLMKQFLTLDRLLWRYQGMKMQRFGPFGNPYRGQGRVLAILKMQPEITQKKLAYLLDMRNQSLGELLSKLEKSGYITREPSQDDRRVMNVTLTDLGKEKAEEMSHPSVESGHVFDCLSDEEQETLSELLERLTAHVEGLQADMTKEEGMPEFNPEQMRGGFGPGHGFHPGFRGDGPRRGDFPHGMNPDMMRGGRDPHFEE
ncbi:MarR family transcriptional regulator [Listeria fleischmannii 1991]|uniref:Transcriptional regulator SlyA n=3 Tax=Listeria fleischmannii TaxID=1069827 RepID=A0A2X3JFB1_9LIST|nr:MarR family transcriptional regulator [Listeria fleischmannii]KMT58694.1 MarR family transcriptional regulator [Listeria fleischmannii 1991]SQC71799.1 transcriptional regulator SlyA [Listeria fleischmannii subsp. fleischmannii]